VKEAAMCAHENRFLPAGDNGPDRWAEKKWIVQMNNVAIAKRRRETQWQVKKTDPDRWQRHHLNSGVRIFYRVPGSIARIAAE
jgi:hypothetical protein